MPNPSNDKDKTVDTLRTWITPDLEELDLNQTLTGIFPWTEEVIDSEGRPVTYTA